MNSPKYEGWLRGAEWPMALGSLAVTVTTRKMKDWGSVG
jgi:hypothetical protein